MFLFTGVVITILLFVLELNEYINIETWCFLPVAIGMVFQILVALGGSSIIGSIFEGLGDLLGGIF